jgi:hypothetical protein
VRGLREGRFDHFSDHSISEYVTHIRAAVEGEMQLRILPLRKPAVVAKRTQRAAA